jgi:hypothetical protein
MKCIPMAIIGFNNIIGLIFVGYMIMLALLFLQCKWTFELIFLKKILHMFGYKLHVIS